jgi:glycosyltransferase involved in cell wall biosynthesis
VASTRRKVVQLTPFYPPHIGGVERVAEALATGLSADHDVEVWTTDLATDRATVPATGAFRVIRFPAFEVAHTPIARGLFRRLLTLPADSVVHVHVAQAVWPELVAVAARRRGFRVVAHFHLDVDPTGPSGFLLPAYKRHFLRHSLRCADAVVTLTTTQCEFLRTTYDIDSDHLHVLPNGVDPMFFSSRARARPTGQALRALFVGRLDPQKNVPRLLRALAQVPDPVELVLVGDGQERAHCQSISAELGLSRVRFVGIQRDDALLAWYDWADIFVLPSDREGMPLALLEAMASGLAVVATDVSDLAVQVGDGGLVVPPDEEHLVGAISALASDDHLLSTLQDRSRVQGRRFGWEPAITRLADLYESLPA